MEHCPKCWQKEQESTLITDDETGEDYCPECGFVSADPEKKTESKFQEKDDFRGTDEETGESKSQHAPKDVGDYGGTGMGGKDASGRPVAGPALPVIGTGRGCDHWRWPQDSDLATSVEFVVGRGTKCPG